MDKACSYEQWAAAGYMLDREEGRDLWKFQEKSSDYDYELIKDRLAILKTIRKNYDLPAMVFNLRTSLCRNLGDMGNQKLYENTHQGTKLLIEDYIDEVTKQLNFICDVELEGVDIQEKLEFFRNTQKSFGRTALLLSGGGTFGLAHAGVCKALIEQKLLPKVITGSSAGSIVAAVVGTRTDNEMHHAINFNNINLNFFERPHERGNIFLKLSRFIKHGVVLDVEVFNECMKENIGDITFAEAYNRTRRILNITVSSSTNYEMPRLLNYLTAPNVLIRSAVAASSAVPFVYRSAPLLAKDSQKNIVPWNPSGHMWIDGSVEGDLPMQRISELFGVNHYCVSQTNPHIIPFLNPSGKPSTIITRTIKSIGSIISTEFSHRITQLFDLGLHNSLVLKGHAILCQKYVGDITIVPYFPWLEFPLVMSSPNVEMAKKYSREGERACWRNIAIIRNHCAIEQCINQNIMSLREQLVLNHKVKVVQELPAPIRQHSLLLPSRQAPLLPAQSLINLEVDKPEPVKLVRNHKSAGDVRAALGGLTAIPVTRAKPVATDPLFYLDLTFEESDED
ncbi:hypothetical protein HK103_006668 [Boothiomyces macroporosus]|uniref:PNPLA domain-containing protein n=1 Tax=Boothiomyces macroporosus TaxID=261099 RepID=A0AAD5UHH6_9FUNG|nr:hypothetical protein HK103_006668 [Boothiomyces macroporosus]